MRLLLGSELAGYIKERQAHQVRALRQAHSVFPKLAIIQTTDDPVINKYVSLKKQYGDDILIEVEAHHVDQADALSLIHTLNNDKTVHGIIVQLPVSDPNQTDELVNAVDPLKDVDGLGAGATLDPATPMAINWLLAAYNVNLTGKHIVIVGQGRLVGKPLAKMMQQSGLDVTVVTKTTDDLKNVISNADVIITGTGVPKLITSDMVRPNAIVVDAGVATDAGKLVGDVAPEVYERQDLTITPVRGGVGPLTVCALFDNVIRAAQAAT